MSEPTVLPDYVEFKTDSDQFKGMVQMWAFVHLQLGKFLNEFSSPRLASANDNSLKMTQPEAMLLNLFLQLGVPMAQALAQAGADVVASGGSMQKLQEIFHDRQRRIVTPGSPEFNQVQAGGNKIIT